MKVNVHRHRIPSVAFGTALLVVVMAVASPARAGGLLWRVSGDAATAYVLGSLHFGADDMYPLHPRIERAMQEADRLMVEVNLLQLDPLRLAEQILNEGMQPPPQTLRDQVPEDLWQALFQLSRRLQVPVATFERQRPWLAALTVGSISVLRLGLDERRGVDLHVMQQLQGRVPILELESFDAQIRLLSGIPAAEQVALLQATVSGYDEAQALVKRMLDAWRAGDAGLMESLMAQDAALGGEAARGLKTRLLDERNVTMARRIKAQMGDAGVILVVVGAGHLVGENSIIRRLAADGFSVQHVDTSGP